MNQIARVNKELFDASHLDEGRVHRLLATRASTAGYSSQPLRHDEVLALLEAGRSAPSFFNSQPWRFIVIENGPGRDEIDRDLNAWGASWAIAAPLLIAITADLSEGIEHGGLNYAHFDCGAAMQNILLQANAMGLDAHPVVCNDRHSIEHSLLLPLDTQLLVFVAVGHPTGKTIRTNSSRLRKPVHAVARWNTWEGPQVLVVD